jgi:hypothetical protein
MIHELTCATSPGRRRAGRALAHLLDYSTPPQAAPGLIRPGRLDGLRLTATDTDWSSGAGAEVAGPIEAVGMAITGRAEAVKDLQGAGAARSAPSPTAARRGHAPPQSR